MPFQQVVTDHFSIDGFHYLIYADRFSGWTEVDKVASTGMTEFEKCVLKWFRTFGVPEEVSADGGPPFNSAEYASFAETWGISIRKSSAYYPQSNGRAEAAVKAMKRCLMGNIDPRNGSLNNVAVSKAIMTQRNTPCQDTGVSPAEMLYGYRIRDHLPNKFREVRKEWSEIQDARELRNSLNQEKMVESASKRSLRPLEVGDTVRLQNQTGIRAKRWSNTGKVVKVLPYRQYGVVIDGSRRVTMRNRRFLRKIEKGQPTNRQITVPYQPPPIVISNIPVTRDQTLPSPTTQMTPPAVLQSPETRRPTTLRQRTTSVQTTPNPSDAQTIDVSPEEVRPPTTPGVRAPVQDVSPQGNQVVTMPMVTPDAGNLMPAVSANEPAARRNTRTLNELRDYNNRGLKELPLETDQVNVQEVRRSGRTSRRPDRFDGQR